MANITIIKWLLLMIALCACMIPALYYLECQLNTPPSPLSIDNTVSREQKTIDVKVISTAKLVDGYAMASDFYQQQIGAAINLFNFQTWAATVSPRMRVVEPFVIRSKFVMPYDLSPSLLQATLRFSDYFNINYWNKRSGVDALVSWEEFVASKPKHMILVIIVRESTVRESTGRVVREDEEIMENEACYTKLKQFNNTYINSVHKELNITIIRQVCFTFGNNINESLSMKEFNHYIFKQWIPSQVMVWFTCWSGITRGRMSITDSKYQMSNKPYQMIQQSDRVNDDSMKYAMSNLQPNYTAVSIRTVKPWLILTKKHDPEYVKNYLLNCINKLGELLNHIHSTQHIYGKPFLAIDLGSYGDMSAKKFVDKETMRQLLEQAVDTVYQNNTSVKEWEKSFTTSIKHTADKGYIAAVQAAIVENANCIIVMGGYSRFQYNIITNYYLKNNHAAPCIHRLCYG